VYHKASWWCSNQPCGGFLEAFHLHNALLPGVFHLSRISFIFAPMKTTSIKLGLFALISGLTMACSNTPVSEYSPDQIEDLVNSKLEGTYVVKGNFKDTANPFVTFLVNGLGSLVGAEWTFYDDGTFIGDFSFLGETSGDVDKGKWECIGDSLFINDFGIGLNPLDKELDFIKLKFKNTEKLNLTLKRKQND